MSTQKGFLRAGGSKRHAVAATARRLSSCGGIPSVMKKTIRAVRARHAEEPVFASRSQVLREAPSLSFGRTGTQTPFEMAGATFEVQAPLLS